MEGRKERRENMDTVRRSMVREGEDAGGSSKVKGMAGKGRFWYWVGSERKDKERETASKGWGVAKWQETGGSR